MKMRWVGCHGLEILKSVLITVFGIVVCVGMAGSVHAEVFYIGSGDSIQDAIDEASDGDIIIVDPGTYEENIEISGLNITLKSTDPTDRNIVATTIINGNSDDPCIICDGSETAECVIEGLTLTNGYSEDGGGGIEGHGTLATIRNNIIRNCEDASDDGGGGLAHCNGLIENNVIINNYAESDGGGLAYCNGDVRQNTIWNNESDNEGGGLAYCSGKVRNCIVWDNDQDSGGQIVGGVTPSYCCIENWSGGGLGGNISDDPMMVNATGGDFHLRSDSPCIDAGQLTSLSLSQLDFEGDERGLDGTDETRGDGSDYDIGADEYLLVNRTIHVPADYGTIQAAIDASVSGDEIVVAPGEYFENLVIDGKDIVLRSEFPTDAETVANTVIDGAGSDSVITFAGSETADCVVEGFTITDGSGDGGGGISGAGTNATIRNNVINDNEGGMAGGIYLCSGLIEKNWIVNNYSDGTGGGISSCSGTIQNNIIWKNYADGNGGGIADCSGVTGVIRNNTIWDNETDMYGGGIANCTAVIENCILWNNSASEDDDQFSECTPMFCCIEDGDEDNGNITDDPELADPSNGVFRLTADSSCIDTGRETDLDDDIIGVKRGFDGSDDEDLGDGSDYDIGAYEFIGELTIRSVSPTRGSVEGGYELTIQGQGFDAETIVTIGDRTVTEFVSISSTTITCIVPAAVDSGAVSVVVSNPAEQVERVGCFEYIPVPVIDEISPVMGSIAGGTEVSITGSGFHIGATVLFGVLNAVEVYHESDTLIRCVTPAVEAPMVVDVTVANPADLSVTADAAFTYVRGPSITGVDPAIGSSMGGQTVVVTGARFVDGASVLFGETPAQEVTVTSPDEITCVSPPHESGVVDVSVVNPDGGTGTCEGCYTYLALPSIIKIRPTGGPPEGGTEIVIRGTNFDPEAEVSIGGIPALDTVVSSDRFIRCTTPPHEIGTVVVVVTNPDGQSATALFDYSFGPFVYTVDPLFGPPAGGTTITITGQYFKEGAKVRLGGLDATDVVVVSDTELTCVTPAHGPGVVDVSVTNPDGQWGVIENGYSYGNAFMQLSIVPEAPLALTGVPFKFSAIARMADGTDIDMNAATVEWTVLDGCGAVDLYDGWFEADEVCDVNLSLTVTFDGITHTDTVEFGVLQADGDEDRDGLTNAVETDLRTHLFQSDTDGDGMPDKWEVDNGTDPLQNDADGDLDGDGLANIDEFGLATDPQVADTDGDGCTDGTEVSLGSDPLDAIDPLIAVVSITPAHPVVQTLVQTTFSVEGMGCDGAPAEIDDATVEWDLLSGVGAIDAETGVFESDETGESVVRVTVTRNGVVATASVSFEVTEFIPGDVDLNGRVTAVDVQLVINKSLGIDDIPVDCDINRDGLVDAIDVQLAINAALGSPNAG